MAQRANPFILPNARIPLQASRKTSGASFSRACYIAIVNDQLDMVQALAASKAYRFQPHSMLAAVQGPNRAIFETVVKARRAMFGLNVLRHLIDAGDIVRLRFVIANGKVDYSEGHYDGSGHWKFPEQYADQVAEKNDREVSRKIADLIREAANR